MASRSTVDADPLGAVQAQARELVQLLLPAAPNNYAASCPNPSALAQCEPRPHMDRFNQVVPTYRGGSSSESSSSVVSYSESP